MVGQSHALVALALILHALAVNGGAESNAQSIEFDCSSITQYINRTIFTFLTVDFAN